MASLNKRSSRGYTYWAIVESKRVNGKPRPIILEYLGTADNLLARLKDQNEIKVKSYSHGTCFALLNLVNELKIVQIINKYVPSKQIRNNLTVGASLVLAAIGRICFPTSKDNWHPGWAQYTSLSYLLSMNLKKLNSQHFWDQMHELPVGNIPLIEKEIVSKILKKENVKPESLLYDSTNYYTYINTKNKRCKIAQRGRNKQKRNDLKQFGTILVVSEKWRIPILHKTYNGVLQDRTVLKENLESIFSRFKSLNGGTTKDITLIFDQGNNSKEILKKVSKEIHFIGALSPYQHKDLINEANKSFVDKKIKGREVPCYRTRQTVWGMDLTIVVYVSKKLRDGQMRGTLNYIKKTTEALNKLTMKLITPPKKKIKNRTTNSIKKQITKILEKYKSKNWIKYELTKNTDNTFSLKSWINETEINRLYNEVFGRRILMTNRHNYKTEKIITSYWCQSYIERVFRDTKNPFHLAVRPQFHWTDQKIIVHNFILLIALMLVSVLYKRACEKVKYKGSWHSLLEKLNNIRLATIIKNANKKTKGRFQVSYELEALEKEQIKVANTFCIDNTKFKANPGFSVYM